MQNDGALFERYRDPDDSSTATRSSGVSYRSRRHVAARYQSSEELFDDVFQVACYGLVKAVDRFDVDRGIAFSSYAVPHHQR